MLFLFLNFVVSFLSDILLNKGNLVPSLNTYFYNQSSLKTAMDAGITVLLAVVITMGISFVVFRFSEPTNIKSLSYFCILAFLVGYVMDVFIYKFNVFEDRLNEYYKTMGVGLWGGLALIFSIVVSFVLQKYIKRVWKK